MKAYLPLLAYPLAIAAAIGLGSTMVLLVPFKEAPVIVKLSLPKTINSLDRGMPKLADASTLGKLSPSMISNSKAATKKWTTKSKAKFHLYAVMIDGDQRLANINGKLVAENERIGAYRVTKIEAGKVLLKGSGQSVKLKLW